MKRLLLFGALFSLGACANGRPAPPYMLVDRPLDGVLGTSPTATPAEVELVESAPTETSLNHADVRDAADVWPELVDRAKRTLDFAQFYASDAAGQGTSRLGPVLAAIERAIARGVRVRFLADAVFAPKYPATLERLRKAGALMRIIDCGPRYGGVQHAKYMVVDGEESFVGSQNFDWRALEHIQEIGIVVRSPVIAHELEDLFETDWALADASTPPNARAARDMTKRRSSAFPVTTRTGERIALYASPKDWLIDESAWDLPRLVSMLDGARSSVNLQVLVYSAHHRDKSSFTTLDDALRRAAARGVHVRLLVSHWGTKADSPARASVEALARLPNVTVRVITIPQWSGGEIPFARVAHAKYMVVDGTTAWIGTSNWEGDYFLKSRNVAIVAQGGKLAARLDSVFEDGWSSAYAAPLVKEPRASSTAPREDVARP